MSYLRFAAMTATSTLVMFGLMYLNTYSADHVFFSQTRAWMALVMGAAMAGVMLVFMWGMYKSKFANIAILVAAAAVFVASLALVRSQATVGDVSYMQAVRRQGFWDNRRRELTEALVHQVCHIRPLHLDEASGAV